LIWASLTLRLAGLVFDAFWHAEHSDFDAVTGNEMIEHLRTVHLPIYIGVFFVVVTTALALLRQIERSERGAALPIAFAGALISAAAESWHSYTHMQLSTHGGPLAASVSFLGVAFISLSTGYTRHMDFIPPPLGRMGYLARRARSSAAMRR